MAGKTVKQLYGNGQGQSFMDRVNAAKHSVTGAGLAKVVCKATTEEMAAPKKKHLEYLVQCTFEQNVSIPELANLLIERTQQSNWVIVFKSLITIHHLMNFGNERFFQYLASNNSQLSLSNFNDRTGIQAFDMSKFVRQYSRYVEQKSKSYRDMAFDFCKIKRGKEEGVMRKMSAEKLMKTIPILETQLDSMLDFDANGSEIHHSIVYAAFLLLYKDAIRLFATYNDGIINLIEKYFTMTKKQCKEALDCYKKFTKRMDRLNKFLRLAEEIGFGEQNGLELQPVPPAVLEALENHLNMLEGKKINEASVSSSTITNVKSSSDFDSSPSFSLTDAEKQKIIEEEKAKLEEYATKRSQNAAKAFTAMTESAAHKSILASSNAPSGSGSSLNGQSLANRNSGPPKSNSAKAIDDLVLLDLDPIPNQNPVAAPMPGGPSTGPAFISPEVADLFGVNTAGMMHQQQQPSISHNTAPFMPSYHTSSVGNFGINPATSSASEINFDKAFGNSGKFNGGTSNGQLSSIAYQPSASKPSPPAVAGNSSSTGPNAGGAVSGGPSSAMSLDAKLASLVGNLDISPAAKIQAQAVTSVNWGGGSTIPVAGGTSHTANPNNRQPAQSMASAQMNQQQAAASMMYNTGFQPQQQGYNYYGGASAQQGPIATTMSPPFQNQPQQIMMMTSPGPGMQQQHQQPFYQHSQPF